MRSTLYQDAKKLGYKLPYNTSTIVELRNFIEKHNNQICVTKVEAATPATKIELCDDIWKIIFEFVMNERNMSYNLLLVNCYFSQIITKYIIPLFLQRYFQIT